MKTRANSRRSNSPQWMVGLALVLISTFATAHKPSDSYLTLQIAGNQIHGQWDIALRDLDYAIGLDTDQNNAITWGELRAQHATIASYALSRLHLSAEHQRCNAIPVTQLVDNHSDGAYEVLRFNAKCPHAVGMLSIDYRLFSDLDPQHKGLLQIVGPNGTRTAILGSPAPLQSFDLGINDWRASFKQYLSLGIWHIWTGFDHLLFLFSLLLPAVLTWHGARWQGSTSLRASLLDIAKVVTAFTLAHSVTLSLAALNVLSLPSRLVESTIAASVILAALNNVYPLVSNRRWLLAFCFGLIHGFGFAAVLRDLGLPSGALLTSLVAFNLGVECGQLSLVALFIPLAWPLRSGVFYRRVMFGGSFAIAALALVWFSERAFLLKIL